MQLIQLAPGAGAGETRVRFAATDPVFAGHFPQAPILPGVALIDAAVEIVSRVRKQPLRLERLSNVKFCSAVLPEQEIGFTFHAAPVDGDAGRVKVSGRWLRGAEKVAEMVFTAVPVSQGGGAT